MDLQVEEMEARSEGIAMGGREFETALLENLVLESRVWVLGGVGWGKQRRECLNESLAFYFYFLK